MSAPSRTQRFAVVAIVAFQIAGTGWLTYLQSGQKKLAQRIEPFQTEHELLVQEQAETAKRTEILEGQLQASEIPAQIEQILKQQADTESRLLSLQNLQGEIDQLGVRVTAHIESIDGEIARLKNVTSPTALPASVSATKSSITRKQPKSLAEPPFAFIGVETRASEVFASIAPKGAASLDALRLLRPGEQFKNSRLLKIEANGGAVFSHDGHKRTISLQ